MESFADQSPPPLPKTWLVESILVTLFCCLPLGIVGIVYAARVQGKYRQGEYAVARQLADRAGLFAKIGFFLAAAAVITGGIITFIWGPDIWKQWLQL